IGLGIARSLAADGFDIALTGIGEPIEGDPALAELRAIGTGAIYVQSDLACLESHQVAVDAVMQRFGRIDCLVNNAGIASVVRGELPELAPENVATTIATTLRGTPSSTQAVLTAVLATESRGPRSIVNITSVSAAMSSPERLDYCMSKAALSSFSQ